MKKSTFLFLLVSAALWAGCEESFSKSGNALTGTRFSAAVTVPELSVADAIAQLRAVALARKYDILTEDGTNGSMLLEDRADKKHGAIPYVISASPQAAPGQPSAVQVQILVKLKPGAFAKADAAKTELCTVLGELRGGAEGRQLAAKALGVSPEAEAPRQVDAYVLSVELARQNEESSESIPLRYKNRRFTVSGRVDYVIKDGDFYRVAFDIPEPKSLVNLPGLRPPPYKIDLSCLMAPNQAALALALRRGEKITLTGAYHDFDSFKKVMWLKGCTAQ